MRGFSLLLVATTSQDLPESVGNRRYAFLVDHAWECRSVLFPNFYWIPAIRAHNLYYERLPLTCTATLF